MPEILAGNTGEVRGYPVYDLLHVPRWSRDRVVAVGDAVHATSPSAGQGASLALEDTIVLAQCLRDLPTPERAFTTYQQIRQPRVERVVGYAQQITKHKTISTNPLAMAIRDLVLPIFLRKAANDTRLHWLYNHHIPWDQPINPEGRNRGRLDDLSGPREPIRSASTTVSRHIRSTALEERIMTAIYTFDVFSTTLDGFGSYSSRGDWGGDRGKQGPEFLDRRLALYCEEQRMVYGARGPW